MTQIRQTLSGKSKFVSKINQSIYVNNELKRTRTNSNCMSSFQFVAVRCLNYLWNRRMLMNPRASASNVTPVDCVHMYASALAYMDVYSAQSVFYRCVSAFIGVHPRLIYRTAPAEER